MIISYSKYFVIAKNYFIVFSGSSARFKSDICPSLYMLLPLNTISSKIILSYRRSFYTYHLC
nr:MAG TPA: hypothetical protein [Caudoviricetes sp.]